MAKPKLRPRRARLGVAPAVQKKTGTCERWAPEEHARLLEGLEIHGRRWKLLAPGKEESSQAAALTTTLTPTTAGSDVLNNPLFVLPPLP